MTNENELIQKLMVSKKIMDRHTQMPRGNAEGIMPSSPMVEEYAAPQATYNLPQEFMQESRIPTQAPQPVTKDRVMASKLPDEIKMLMIEHPINQPNTMAGPSISNELAEKASRLMGVNAAGQQTQQRKPQQQVSTGLDSETIKSIVRETVEEVLAENGLLVESTGKSNDTFSFKVGKHIFEGKVTKIKKVQ